MKTPLRYQVTQFDCGTTSFVNALLYLFHRAEIPPEVVEYITAVTGDKNVGIGGTHKGTSAKAFAFLSAWLNDYVASTGFPVRCEQVVGSEVTMEEGSPLVEGMRHGAIAVTGCCLGADHYVLVTGFDGNRVFLFDPYYDTWPMHELSVPVVGVEMDWDHPHEYNRVVERWVFDAPAGTPYSLEARSGRDAVLIWRTDGAGHAVQKT